MAFLLLGSLNESPPQKHKKKIHYLSFRLIMCCKERLNFGFLIKKKVIFENSCQILKYEILKFAAHLGAMYDQKQ